MAKKISRRAFFRTILAGGIGAATATLLLKDKIDFTNCINNSFCRKCKIVKNCELPQALSFRSANR